MLKSERDRHGGDDRIIVNGGCQGMLDELTETLHKASHGDSLMVMNHMEKDVNLVGSCASIKTQITKKDSCDAKKILHVSAVHKKGFWWICCFRWTSNNNNKLKKKHQRVDEVINGRDWSEGGSCNRSQIQTIKVSNSLFFSVLDAMMGAYQEDSNVWCSFYILVKESTKITVKVTTG